MHRYQKMAVYFIQFSALISIENANKKKQQHTRQLLYFPGSVAYHELALKPVHM